mgnify:FL=1
MTSPPLSVYSQITEPQHQSITYHLNCKTQEIINSHSFISKDECWCQTSYSGYYNSSTRNPYDYSPQSADNSPPPITPAKILNIYSSLLGMLLIIYATSTIRNSNNLKNINWYTFY